MPCTESFKKQTHFTILVHHKIIVVRYTRYKCQQIVSFLNVCRKSKLKGTTTTITWDNFKNPIQTTNFSYFVNCRLNFTATNQQLNNLLLNILNQTDLWPFNGKNNLINFSHFSFTSHEKSFLLFFSFMTLALSFPCITKTVLSLLQLCV